MCMSVATTMAKTSDRKCIVIEGSDACLFLFVESALCLESRSCRCGTGKEVDRKHIAS